MGKRETMEGTSQLGEKKLFIDAPGQPEASLDLASIYALSKSRFRIT
jgi:hypothetical protein